MPSPSSAGDQPAGQDQHRQRRLDRLDEEDRGVGAEREERRRAEVHVARVAAQDVPRGGDHDVLEDHVAGEVEVRVRPAAGQRGSRPRSRPAPRQRSRRFGASSARRARPAAPRARCSRCRTRPRATTTGPKNVAMRLSTTPEDHRGDQRAADAAHAASTVMANIRPM